VNRTNREARWVTYPLPRDGHLATRSSVVCNTVRRQGPQSRVAACSNKGCRMNIRTRALLLLIILPATLAACALGTPSPYISIKPVIQFVPEKMSPKWNELTREIVPERINRKARAQLVGYENVTNPMYRLVLHFVSTNREVTGSSSGGGGLVGPLGVGGIGVGVGG